MEETQKDITFSEIPAELFLNLERSERSL